MYCILKTLDSKHVDDKAVLRQKYLCDTASDVEALPTSSEMGTCEGHEDRRIDKCAAGSIAIVAEDGASYLLNNSDEWIQVTTGESGGGSTVEAATAEEIEALAAEVLE